MDPPTSDPVQQLQSLQTWRERVLRGMLTVGAIGGPLVVVVSLVFNSAGLSLARVVVLMLAGLTFPILRLARGVSFTVRASIVIGVSYMTGVVALATFGFSSGPGIVLAGTSMLAVVYFGRTGGILMLVLSTLAYFAVGLLASRAVVTIHAAELDPAQIQNWKRIGSTFALLSALLMTAIDFVIRHVEESSHAATEALVALRHAYERLELLHERLDAAKEEERRFIAHELHDDLGQVLTLIKLRLQMRASSERAAAIAGREAVALVDQAIERVRKISSDLRPPLLDEMGLLAALRAYGDSQSALSGVEIEVETAGPQDERLAPMLEVACFRVVQEALTNALRHAAPRRIHVRATHDAGSIALSIRDDGSGFDVTSLQPLSARHLGIAGMEERVRARLGTFRITSKPGAGTRVDAQMPIAP